MPDALVKIYIYFLIFGSLLFALLHGGLWFTQRQRPRHPLVKRNLVWRNLFFFVSGIVAWYLFYFHLLGNTLLLVCVLIMTIVSYLIAEVLGRKSTRKPTL